MPLKVLNEHLVHAVRSRRIAAGISHGASAAIEILPHYHRDFPQSRIRSRGTGWYHAVVEELVVQRVRPTGRSVFVNRHGRIIGEVCVPQHLEHVVPADLENVSDLSMSDCRFYVSIKEKSFLRVESLTARLSRDAPFVLNVQQNEFITDKKGALIPLTSSSLTPP